MGFPDKVVLVTGAGRGLGKAVSLDFLLKGWRVIASDLSLPDFGDKRSAEVSGIHPEMKTRFMLLEMDVTSDESVNRAFSAVRAENIILDLIINNAGADNYFPLSGTPVSEFRKIFEINCFGAYRVNQVFLPLVRKPGGRIIHIGSESLNLTMPFMPYPLSKKLLEGYAKALRFELKFHGIEVVTIRSGAINTDLLRTVSELPESVFIMENGNPLEKVFRVFSLNASKEIGKVISPEKAAEFIFLVSSIPRPKAVYRINNMLKLRIAAMLPYSLVEKIVYRRLTPGKK